MSLFIRSSDFGEQSRTSLFPAIFGRSACSVFWRFLSSIRLAFICCLPSGRHSSVLARRSDRATICSNRGLCRRSFCRYSPEPICTRLRHGGLRGDCCLFGNLRCPRLSPADGCTRLVSSAYFIRGTGRFTASESHIQLLREWREGSLLPKEDLREYVIAADLNFEELFEVPVEGGVMRLCGECAIISNTY
jgi:hypothetical protein